MQQASSNIFEGYRSLGNVTGPKPFIIRYGTNLEDTRIYTIVGRTFHCYNSKLALIEASLPHEHDVETLTCDQNYVFSASANVVLCWAKGSKRVLHRFIGHKHNVHMLTRAARKLYSVDESSEVIVWNLEDSAILTRLKFHNEIFQITCFLHPFDYPNKILLASAQGQLQLWNTKSEALLFSFDGWNSKVTCLQQSPVVDVIAVGLESGTVVLHNIRYNETVLKLDQEYGAITSMSFRADGEPYIATASDAGHVILWNLEKKRLQSQMRNAHVGPVKCCRFIKNQPLLVTSGSDNSLKTWCLDMSDGGGRLLTQRSGHSGPPNYIRFYGDKGYHLLSAGQDSTLKCFHVLSERLNRNLGTAKLNPKSKDKANEATKLPAITRFAAETVKEGQWDNIVACHKNSSDVTTWNYNKCSMGSHRITQPTFNKHGVASSCICITNCGNFTLIGYTNGNIFRYNLQSGLFRTNYHDQNLDHDRAHESQVSGIVVDSLNGIIVSGGADQFIKFWNFKTGKLLQTLKQQLPITKIELHRDNNLIAVAIEGYSGKEKLSKISIIDIELRSAIRVFDYGDEVITDMAFFSDSRWFIASSLDKTVKVWDIGLGKLIDAFSVSHPCTSITISPTGEFLATAHQGQLGINLWSNFTIYCGTPIRVLSDDYHPKVLDLPHVHCDDAADQETTDVVEDSPDNEILVEYKSPEQLDKELISLSGLPASRWKNLLQIDSVKAQQVIDEENQDKKNPIPFFIPTVAALKPSLDIKALDEQMESDQNYETKQSELYKSRTRELCLISPLGELLLKCDRQNDYNEFFNVLKDMGPSSTDAEIRSMGDDTCGTNKVMIAFIRAMTDRLQSNRDYELVNSWLALFLKLHSDSLRNSHEYIEICSHLINGIETKWNRLSDESDQIFCILKFIRSSIL